MGSHAAGLSHAGGADLQQTAASRDLAARMMALQNHINGLSDEELLNPARATSKLSFISAGSPPVPTGPATAPSHHTPPAAEQQASSHYTQQQPFAPGALYGGLSPAAAQQQAQLAAGSSGGVLGALSAMLNNSSPQPSRTASLLYHHQGSVDVAGNLGTTSMSLDASNRRLTASAGLQHTGTGTGETALLYETLDRDRDGPSANGTHAAYQSAAAVASVAGLYNSLMHVAAGGTAWAAPHGSGFAPRSHSYAESSLHGEGAGPPSAVGGGNTPLEHLFSTVGSSYGHAGGSHPLGAMPRYASDGSTIMGTTTLRDQQRDAAAAAAAAGAATPGGRGGGGSAADSVATDPMHGLRGQQQAVLTPLSALPASAVARPGQNGGRFNITQVCVAFPPCISTPAPAHLRKHH